MKLSTLAAKVNKYAEAHNEVLVWVLIIAGAALIVIGLLPKQYAALKIFMISYAVLPLPW